MKIKPIKSMNKENQIQNQISKLKSNPLISEIEILNPDECIGINEDQLYLTITHHSDLTNDPIYLEFRNNSEIDSCDLLEDNLYETQLILEIN